MAQNPNPFRSTKEWGLFVIGGWTVPATLVKVDGVARPYEWVVQKGTNTGGATTVFRGKQVCEAPKTTFQAWDIKTFDALYDFRDRIEPKREGDRPPTLQLIQPIFNFCKIDRLSLKLLGAPMPTPGLGYLLEVTWIEYRPSKPAKVGPQDPALPPGVPSPADAVEEIFADLAAKAGALSGGSTSAIGSNSNTIGGIK